MTVSKVEPLMKFKDCFLIILYQFDPPPPLPKLQPIDILVNKLMKKELRIKLQAWYASEVEKQMKDVPIEQVKVKGRSANWTIAAEF